MILNVGWFAENHVAANLLMLFLLLAGALTGLTMKLEVFPEASLDRVNISMAYSGASPAEFIGVRKGEIHIEISESNLCQYGLTWAMSPTALEKPVWIWRNVIYLN